MPQILIVDDHAGYRAVLRAGLEKLGFRVAELERGADVLRTASANCPDVILLDFDLPDALGPAICAGLKAQPQTAAVPVIIATGRGTEQDRREGLKAGADDFLVKPFTFRELCRRLRVLLAQDVPRQQG